MSRLLAAAVLLLSIGCAKEPDESRWIVTQTGRAGQRPGMSPAWNAKGKPVVSGNTCTFVDAISGETITITGPFEIQSLSKTPVMFKQPPDWKIE